jgi:hypothetical protein
MTKLLTINHFLANYKVKINKYGDCQKRVNMWTYELELELEHERVNCGHVNMWTCELEWTYERMNLNMNMNLNWKWTSHIPPISLYSGKNQTISLMGFGGKVDRIKLVQPNPYAFNLKSINFYIFIYGKMA